MVEIIICTEIRVGCSARRIPFDGLDDAFFLGLRMDYPTLNIPASRTFVAIRFALSTLLLLQDYDDKIKLQVTSYMSSGVVLEVR
jgi:hypothetical protein